MLTVNIDEARTHLARLIDAAANGESFIITKAGKPMVKVVALEARAKKKTRRLGFMMGQVAVPDDFDRMGGKTSRPFSARTSEASS